MAKKAKLKNLPKNRVTIYEVTVKFMREATDDIEVLEGNPKYNGMDFNLAAAIQLATELQAGFDKAGIAGMFVVDEKSIRLGSKEFDKLEKRRQARLKAH